MISYGKGGGIMRDFPVFTTENGVGSLVLKEIPYSGIAYVTIRDSSFPTEFLRECVEFCKAVGADAVYATGNGILEQYPFFTSVIQMCASVDMIEESDASLFPVTEKTVDRWCEIYNKKMKNERARRTELRHERNNEILLMSRNGRTQKQIAEELKIMFFTPNSRITSHKTSVPVILL